MLSRLWTKAKTTTAVQRAKKIVRSLLGRAGGRDSRLDANPWIRDYERLGLVWRPYVMRLCRPNQKTPSASTDALGFRASYHRGVALAYPQYRASSDMSVLLGNSVAFGVGASSDESAMSSQLAQITGEAWQNLSGRASNQLQDVLTLMLFGASEHRNIVLMSGLNDLLFALYFERPTQYVPMFWGEDQFSKLDADASGRDVQNVRSIVSLEERYAYALDGIDRSLMLLASFGRSRNSNLLYALQPLLTWIEKPLHPKEEAVCVEWNSIKKGFRSVHHPDVILSWKERFASDVAALCKKNAVPFIDLNTQEQLATAEHLFVDRIHLSDRGQRVVAEILIRVLRKNESERRASQVAVRTRIHQGSLL